MGFGHERLDVYRAAIDYVESAYRFCEELKGHRNAKDQLIEQSRCGQGAGLVSYHVVRRTRPA